LPIAIEIANVDGYWITFQRACEALNVTRLKCSIAVSQKDLDTLLIVRIIADSVCLLFDIPLPLSFVRNHTWTCAESGEQVIATVDPLPAPVTSIG